MARDGTRLRFNGFEVIELAFVLGVFWLDARCQGRRSWVYGSDGVHLWQTCSLEVNRIAQVGLALLPLYNSKGCVKGCPRGFPLNFQTMIPDSHRYQANGSPRCGTTSTGRVLSGRKRQEYQHRGRRDPLRFWKPYVFPVGPRDLALTFRWIRRASSSSWLMVERRYRSTCPRLWSQKVSSSTLQLTAL
jgi:hypothetical protein